MIVYTFEGIVAGDFKKLSKKKLDITIEELEVTYNNEEKLYTYNEINKKVKDEEGIEVYNLDRTEIDIMAMEIRFTTTEEVDLLDRIDYEGKEYYIIKVKTRIEGNTELREVTGVIKPIISYEKQEISLDIGEIEEEEQPNLGEDNKLGVRIGWIDRVIRIPILNTNSKIKFKPVRGDKVIIDYIETRDNPIVIGSIMKYNEHFQEGEEGIIVKKKENDLKVVIEEKRTLIETGDIEIRNKNIKGTMNDYTLSGNEIKISNKKLIIEGKEIEINGDIKINGNLEIRGESIDIRNKMIEINSSNYIVNSSNISLSGSTIGISSSISLIIGTQVLTINSCTVVINGTGIITIKGMIKGDVF